jgi:hypothetical protein
MCGSTEMELKLYTLHWYTDDERMRNGESAIMNVNNDETAAKGEYAMWTQANVRPAADVCAHAHSCRRL